MQAILALLTLHIFGDAVKLGHHPRLEHFVLFQLLTTVVHDFEIMVQVRVRWYLHAHDLHEIKQILGELLRRDIVLSQLLRQDSLNQPIAIEDTSIDLLFGQHLSWIVFEITLEDGRKGGARMLPAIEVDALARIPGEIESLGFFQIGG